MGTSKSAVVSARALLVTAIGALALSTQSARADLLSAGVNLGGAGPDSWGVLTVGGGRSNVDKLTGTAEVIGNFGAAGSGRISLLGHSLIDGDLYYRSPGKLTIAPNAVVNGSIHHDTSSDLLLDQDAAQARSASDTAFHLTPSPGYPNNLRLARNQTLTLSGTGNVVLKLSNFALSRNATLTLDGTPDTSFVINVSHKFSLTSANVFLTGGLTADNVLFNIRGTGAASLTGTSDLNGIILATNRTVRVNGTSHVIGEVIGKKVNISGGSEVTASP
jgi:cytoskeletal protein CcmA (bactofilin family)